MFFKLVIFATLFLIMSQMCFAQEEGIYNLQHLPPVGQFIYSDKLSYQEDEYEYEGINSDNYSNLEKQSYLNSFSLGYRVSEKYFISLEQRLLLREKYVRYDTEYPVQNRADYKLAEPKIILIKRLGRRDPHSPLLDLIFHLSPYTGEFQSPMLNKKGNYKRGGTDLGAFFRFGVNDGAFDAIGEFFLGFHGTRKGRDYTGTKVEYGPYSSYGINLKAQYLYRSLLAVSAQAKIQRESSMSFKNEYPQHKEQDGYASGAALRLSYIANKNLLIFSEMETTSTGLLNAYDDLEKESAIYSIGIIWK